MSRSTLDARRPPRTGLMVAHAAAALLACCGWSGCRHGEYVPMSATEARTLTPTELRARELPRVIAGYQADERRVKTPARWTLALCDQPSPELLKPVHEPRMSRSKDEQTHGSKISLFYASDAGAYLAITQAHATAPSPRKPSEATPEPAPLPDGMYIVKENWTVEQVALSDLPPRVFREPTYDYVIEHGSPDRAWKRKRRSNTFVMYKPPADSALAAETDAGWIYAVLTPDAKAVIESGLIASCVDCHRHATRERLFGMR